MIILSNETARKYRWTNPSDSVTVQKGNVLISFNIIESKVSTYWLLQMFSADILSSV